MEKILEKDSLSFWTDHFGASYDPPVLLIAGAGASAHFWTESFCQELANRKLFVIRFDHRDTGMSSAVNFATNPYNLAAFMGDALAILDGYGIEKAHIVGHSMGGYIGQLLAISHPERMLSLTTISAGPIGATPEVDIPWTAEEKAQSDKTWKVMLANKPGKTYAESREGYLAVWRYLNGELPLDETIADAYTKDLYDRTKHRPGVASNHVRVMKRVGDTLGERREAITKIALPTLAIHGDHDPLVPIARGAQAIAGAIPGAKLEIISGMGHMIFNKDLEHRLAVLIGDHISHVS